MWLYGFLSLYIYIGLSLYIYIYLYTDVYIFMFRCIHTCTYIYIYVLRKMLLPAMCQAMHITIWAQSLHLLWQICAHVCRGGTSPKRITR